MANLYIGPAGWSYKDWVGPFYPDGKRIDKLLYVAKYFNCVEINSTFYRSPADSLVSSWAERAKVKKGFKFNVKILKKFSHERRFEDIEIEDFIHKFDPLIENNQLGAFLIQFPWSFKNKPDNRKYIERIGKFFSGLPLAVELRHGSWNSSDTLKLLSENELSFCNIDQPLIGSSMPPTNYVPSSHLAYIRLHGRNFKSWFKEDAGRDERYNYLYSINELNEWSNKTSKIAGQAENLFIITNNHFRGQALANAFQMRFLLDGQKQKIPQELGMAFPELGEISKKAKDQGNLNFD